MSTGIYTTTDPDTRIKVIFDDEYPTENPDFPFAPGVLDALIQCYEEGNYYGVILQKRVAGAGCSCQEEWEEEDSIWSCAGYENVAEEVAKEFWNITVTGRE